MNTPTLSQEELMEYAHKIRDYQHAQFIKEGYLVGPSEREAFKEYTHKMTGYELSHAQRYAMGSAYSDAIFAGNPSVDNVLDNELIKSTVKAHIEQSKIIAGYYTDGATFVIDDDCDNDVHFSPDNNGEGQSVAFYITYTLYAFSKGAFNIDDIATATTIPVQ